MSHVIHTGMRLNYRSTVLSVLDFSGVDDQVASASLSKDREFQYVGGAELGVSVSNGLYLCFPH